MVHDTMVYRKKPIKYGQFIGQNDDKPANPTATKRVSSSVSLARQCWKAGEVRDFGEVRKKLENGEAPVGSVALAPSVDKALELKLLAEGHKLDTVKFACLVAGANLSSLPAGVSVVTLPVVTSAGTGIQSTKFHKLACVLLGREAPVLPTGLVKHVASAPVAKELVTLRFVVPRAFLSNEQWQLWKTKATSMIQEWVGMDKNCAIHTSYGWSVTSQVNWKGAREEFLLGYAKVSSDKLEALWCHSGRSGVFLDRLAKERDGSKFVSWLDHGELEALEYLNLALTKAITLKAGVAWRAGGANCLGLCSSVAPTEQSVSVWRAKAVPFAWAESDLFQVLKDAGWTELSVVAYPTRKVRPCPAVLTGGFAGIEVGESLVIMEKAGPVVLSTVNPRSWFCVLGLVLLPVLSLLVWKVLRFLLLRLLRWKSLRKKRTRTTKRETVVLSVLVLRRVRLNMLRPNKRPLRALCNLANWSFLVSLSVIVVRRVLVASML